MKISMQSLRTMPPKQVVVWAMEEKARREKARALQTSATEKSMVTPTGEPPEVSTGSESTSIPTPSPDADAYSLCLRKSSPYYDLLFRDFMPDGRPVRYKIYWGGRGAAKSWAIAEAIIRKMAAKCVRVLCCREIQNTIKDSSHKVLKDTITRLGLDAQFTVTANEIKSRTGAECIFKGLFNNDAGIRSTEGIDICWVEEAHVVSKSSWQSLSPTIRAHGSQIWVSFNMMNETDPTYVRFVVEKRTGCIVHKVNYDANPYFESSPLYQEMLDDKAANYHTYEHIWLGLPLRIDSSIIFSGKYRVEPFADDTWKQADRLFYGVDWGYSQDPSAVVRAFILPTPPHIAAALRAEGQAVRGQSLFCDYGAYATGIELDEYGDFFKPIPGMFDWPVKADGALPATISHVRSKFGVHITAAEKWPGSIEDGIKHLRSYDAIVIHPRCQGLVAEAPMYRYKVDKVTKEVLPVIIDKHNHAWDALRYALDGHIQKGGDLAIWERLAMAQPLNETTV